MASTNKSNNSGLAHARLDGIATEFPQLFRNEGRRLMHVIKNSGFSCRWWRHSATCCCIS